MVGICSGHGCVEGRKSLLKNPFSGVGSCWKACGDVLAAGQFAAHPPHMCRATVKGREMLGKHVGQTAWQNTLADIFVNHLCRRCWPLPLPGGFALMWPGVLSIPRLHQNIHIYIYILFIYEVSINIY